MRIVFMGTPEFAIPSLKGIADSSHTIAGIVTVPDRSMGRGQILNASPVKKGGELLRLPILQPEDLDDSNFMDTLKSWNADCFVVVGFRILPAKVFTLPPRGTINLHASLLPKYRGAAPIQWAIINGDSETGVTTFLIQEKVDTGKICLQERVAIHRGETAGELHDRLAKVGADLLVRTLNLVENNEIQPFVQEGECSKAPKIHPNHGLIDWGKSATSIVNQVRGLSPFPGAFSFLSGIRIKLFQARQVSINTSGIEKPGTVISAGPEGLVVTTGKGCIAFLEIQKEGKKRLPVEAFLHGHEIPVGSEMSSSP